ncbi:hypothetical protein [Ligilactobacillus cholophilus]|uniref:hypothetical protein n=1 Tax=Ligilactobacillus cholophilus TaxID=3050131 RepID=UPI0025B01993|nr:hypothetical protein [Ligilactobacillus cholophilus]
MSNNVDVYNGDIISMLPGSQQDPPLYKSINGDGITDRNSAGEIQAIKLDMTKAGNTFIDLRPIFNANQSDGNIEMPIMPLMYGRQAPLDGFRGEIHGIYPDKIHTFDVDTALGNTGNIYRFLWPTGVFQTTGKYIFTITFINDNTGEKITSKECFFEVEPNLLTMAVNFSEGVNPFDSEYERWKNDVKIQYNDFLDKINTLNDTSDRIEKLMQNTLNKTNQYVEQAWDSKLSGNNTWTGTNTFDGGLTASSINSSGDIQGTTINGNDLKLNNKSLKFTQSGTCTLEGLASNDGGSHISYWVNANTLYITGWVDKPKTTYKTFKAYIPTSITQKAVNKQNYYVAVNDYDWNYPSAATNPTEFHLDGNQGIIYVNGSGNDGGARLDWIIPLKDA